MNTALSNGIDLQSPEYRLEAIPLMLNRHKIVFSKTTAAKLVGGRSRLGKLIERGLVRVEKKASGKQNGKWYCNGGDVIRNMKL
jgi:hypothetical protein